MQNATSGDSETVVKADTLTTALDVEHPLESEKDPKSLTFRLMLAIVPLEVAGALISTALDMTGSHVYGRIPKEVRHNGNQWIAIQHQGLGDDSPRAVRLLVDYGYDAAQRNREELGRLERLHRGVLDVMKQCDTNLDLTNVDGGHTKAWTIKRDETKVEAERYQALIDQINKEYVPVEHMEWQWLLTELDK